MTFGQTIRTLRRDAGMTQESLAELLCSSMINVSEVAYHLGYPDTGYFSRIFRKRF